ncbi:RNA polymerase sigma factor [Lysinibacillus sphaericus]|uniref:sigma-70 family RNA polymerase sigma factor n=1 Tax=Lysinibacillus sphaericus TaxID=1421 RepID=UPI0018CCE5E4|nr:sigma-70 family RNA polymerase sigma factor [Lysinibacillus sphaericus]MBG9455806.1 RNA polymerase sigma factor [Lysinibacillus sphaericus]MBG9477825.1 RNA polymerase sigma factor [Lysinibacillus sphaericus]MBG9593284.1 RNA polymerase sigma factor [Lysinibacillus sphaericus]
MECEIVQRAIRGDHQAILSLIEMDEEILYRMAFTYLKNEQDALDVMQDLVYKALKKMHTVKQHEYARTWLVRVLINCCKDHLRKRKPTVAIKEHHQVEWVIYSDMERLLEHLSLSEQQLVYMKYFQQLKNKEIAELNQIPEGTVKSKLHYILKKLRNFAGEKEDWL